MNLKSRLEGIGLTRNEAKVYMFLIDHGTSKAGKIAKGTEIQRSSCYGAINGLVHKGLIGYALEGKVKLFQATGPTRLQEYMKEQQELVTEILPELRDRHKANKTEGKVRLFKGSRGVKAVFKDIHRSGADVEVWGDDGNFGKRMPIFSEQFIRDQNLKNNKTRMVTRSRFVSNHKGTVHRFVDDTTKSNVAVNIYGGKIAIIVWTDEPEAILIENKTAANAFKSYFEFMWKHAKK